MSRHLLLDCTFNRYSVTFLVAPSTVDCESMRGLRNVSLWLRPVSVDDVFMSSMVTFPETWAGTKRSPKMTWLRIPDAMDEHKQR